MSVVAEYISSAWHFTSIWEILAVVFAITYLLLAIKESIWCWPAALISTLIYGFLFFDVNLYMESALQLFYIVMAFYGWSQWRKNDNPKTDLKVSNWSYKQHLTAISLVALLVVISATLLRNTDAAFPWLDSFSTWGAVIATWMVTKKIIENWLYWIVIDSVNIYLYLQKDLYLTTALFIFYTLMCFVGYYKWKASMTENSN